MIDFHAHILPGIDDGSRNKEMSLAMLAHAKAQGINTIVATPHFYADTMKAEEFIKDRQVAYEEIFDMAKQMDITIRLGAEVCYFRSLHESANLKDFTIQGTNYLLLEMPFDQWTKREVATITGLINQGVTPILAHIERFWPYQKDKAPLEEIMRLDVIYQYNASPLLKFGKGKILKSIKKNDNVLLGTDCHNTSTRPVNLKAARDVIAKKLGEDKLDAIDDLAEQILGI